MNHQTVSGWMLLSLLMSTLVLSYPQAAPSSPGQIATQYIPRTAQHHAEQMQYQQHPEQFARQVPQHYRVHGVQPLPVHDRKFAEKPNALKKVSLDDIDSDIQTNQIQDNLFSWTNMLGSVMQMLFNNAQLANKSDDIDNQVPPSPWTNIIAVGKFNSISQEIQRVWLISSANKCVFSFSSPRIRIGSNQLRCANAFIELRSLNTKTVLYFLLICFSFH